jgi:uncharacterized membrane protein
VLTQATFSAEMLIVFPLGMLATAVALDISAAGILGGLLATLPGLIDWMAIPRNTRAKTIGLWHGGGNVIVGGPVRH